MRTTESAPTLRVVRVVTCEPVLEISRRAPKLNATERRPPAEMLIPRVSFKSRTCFANKTELQRKMGARTTQFEGKEEKGG